MKIFETQISFGHAALLRTFFEANELNVNLEERSIGIGTRVTLSFEENSDTDYSITVMSLRHLGFENMLVDYLKRCGIPVNRITDGRQAVVRSMEELDRQWNEHRKSIGLR